MTQSRRAMGAYGEERVARHYEELGFRVIARNWRCSQGEIDLIAQSESLLVFCEVKTRSTAMFGSAAEAVTPAKQLRIRKLAAIFLSTYEPRVANLRFDVGAVDGVRVDVIEGAF